MRLKNRKFICSFIIAIMALCTISMSQFVDQTSAAVANVNNGVQFTDTNGNVVHAHGGGMIKVGTYYYWLGENRDGANLVSLYRSTDLKNWQFRAHLLSKSMGGELATANIERPKLLFNASTNKYVMWMHKENGINYNEGMVAVASATNIEGPYTYHGSFRPLNWESRDMTVFNDNGTAYLVSSTKGSGTNSDLNIFQLTPDFLNVQTLLTTLWPGQYREAPAMFKRNGVFFLITSGATGWNPNQAKYSTASSAAGSWTNPVNFGDSTTYGSQSAYVIPVVGSSTTSYLYMGDRWAGAWSGPVNDSQYVWLPLIFPSSTSLSMDWANSIDIDTVTGIITGSTSGGPFNPSTEYKLINRNSGKALDVAGQSTTNGANIAQWDYWGGNNQKWNIVGVGNYYRITNINSGKSMEINSASTANGGNAAQWDYNSGNHQQWTITAVGNYYRITNRNSGKALDIDQSSTANGGNAQQWDYWGGNNQQWQIVPAN
jgi:hypothetical protein